MLGWKLVASLLPLLLAPVGPSVIEMRSTMVFQPKELTVVAGEVVVWKNTSQMPHSVNTIPEECKTDEGRSGSRCRTEPWGSIRARSGPTRSTDSASTCRVPTSTCARSTKTK